MAIMVSAEVSGQTQQGYDGMASAIGEYLSKAPGFIMHTSYPKNDGWYIVEIWNSKADADLWFAKSVVPNLPPGIRPKRTYQELHNIMLPR
jgi:heme-degrading monooxygenase HmoA